MVFKVKTECGLTFLDMFTMTLTVEHSSLVDKRCCILFQSKRKFTPDLKSSSSKIVYTLRLEVESFAVLSTGLSFLYLHSFFQVHSNGAMPRDTERSSAEFKWT